MPEPRLNVRGRRQVGERFNQTDGRKRLLRAQGGFTVAELLAASAVIGIALLALLRSIPLSAYGIQEGSQQSTAVFLANERMEQVKNAVWTAVPVADTLGVSASSTLAPVNAAAVTTFPDESPVAAPYAGYSRRVRIADCNVAPGCGGLQKADLRQATVTVSYSPMTGVGAPALGASKSVVVTMIIAMKCFRATAADPCT